MKSLFSIALIVMLILGTNFVPMHGQALNVPANFPKYEIVTNNSPDDGYYFLSPVQMPNKTPGYLIVIDNYGTPVYYRYFNKVLNSFGVQPNKKLSFMGRTGTSPMFYIMDSTYTIIDSVKCKTYKTDPHDFMAMKNGHFLFICGAPKTLDMTAYGGKSNATVTGCVVQELDENKNVVFEWSTWDHFNISDSYADLTVSSVDLIHPNSIDVDEDGNIFLISRSMNEVTKINRQTGDIMWRLGGKNNQFTFTDPTSMFSMPHDFRLLPTGNFTIFDNGNERIPPYSRSLEYSIDQVNKTVDLVWSYDGNKEFYSSSSGSTQRLPSGNTVIGYGYDLSSPALIEVHYDKSVALRLNFPDKVTSYRAVKFPWKTTLFVPNTYSIDFGMWDTYTTQSYLLPVYNNSGNVVTLTSYSTRTSAFTIEELFPIDIPAHGQVTLTVDYFPAGIKTGFIKDVLTINSDINTSKLVQRIAQQVQLTGKLPDYTAPTATIPLANKINVPMDTVIYINFSEPVRKLDNSEFTYENVDPIIILKKDDASGEDVPFDAVINTDKTMITITPANQLASIQKYYVAITNDYEDYSNNRGTANSATFITIDKTPPVVTITPSDGTTDFSTSSPILIQFNEPVRNLDNSELTDATVASLLTLKTGDVNGTDVSFSATINTEKTIITVTPGQLLPGTTYYVAIGASVEDYNNNPSAATSSTFTTSTTTGVEENTGNFLKVFPNPGNGLFTFEASPHLIKGIKVTDLTGRIIYEKSSLPDGFYQLDLRTRSAGIYLLYIEESGSEKIHIYKLIKSNAEK